MDKNGEDLEMLNVIIMPHSHVDPGWQKTTNEYYTDQTKHIFTNMVNKLTEHPDLSFVWAETVYFAMWWNELEDAVKVCVCVCGVGVCVCVCLCVVGVCV